MVGSFERKWIKKCQYKISEEDGGEKDVFECVLYLCCPCGSMKAPGPGKKQILQ
jgi:hypothetical protein